MKCKVLIAVVLIAVAAVVSCKKGDDTAGVKEYTSVNLINATTDTLNLYVNGSRVNTTNALYPLGSSGYINTLTGEQNYQVRKAGKPEVLFSLPLTLDKEQVYSFFLAGNTAEQAFTDIDTLSSAAPDTTLIRFVHTSPNVGNIDVMVGDTLKFAGKSFKSISDYFPIGIGPKRIRVYKAGTSTLLSDQSRILNAGRAYTLFTKSNLSADAVTTTGTGIMVNR